MAVRVETSGPCPAHRQIAAQPQQWINELRSAAMDVGGGRVWIEKVRTATSLPLDLDDAIASDGPVGELARLIEELKSDPQSLGRMLDNEMAELKKKLPVELVEGPESFDPGRPESAAGLLDEVRQMLVSQLGAREADA
jgi:hypothetical protein